MDKQTLRVSFLSKGLAWVEFTRHKQLNTFTKTQYTELADTLDELAQHESCSVCVITSNGPYFSAGTDLTVFPHDKVFPSHEEEVEFYYNLTMSQAGRVVNSLINFPKILIYAVQGPAIGFSATISQLCDLVYCSDSAYFHTPFMALSFCAEGCSSYTFPRVLGKLLANDVLLGGRQLDANTAAQHGFVNQVFPITTFKQEVFGIAAKLGSMSSGALRRTKMLCARGEKEILLKVNQEELYNLSECFASDATKRALKAFQEMQKRKAQSRIEELRKRQQQQQQQQQQQLHKREQSTPQSSNSEDQSMKHINMSNFYIYKPSNDTSVHPKQQPGMAPDAQSPSSATSPTNPDIDIDITSGRPPHDEGKGQHTTMAEPGATTLSSSSPSSPQPPLDGHTSSKSSNTRLNTVVSHITETTTTPPSQQHPPVPRKKPREYEPVPPLL